MSHPFVIWTFQRTGGTTLSAALSDAFVGQGVTHEPFNKGREFERIATIIKRNNLKEGALLLDQVLDKGVSIKHCFELHSKKFNKLFLERLSTCQPYRHIVLMRETETERLCSLYLAKQTAVWGKWKADKGGYDEILEGNMELEPFPIDDMLKHGRHCVEYRKWLMKEMYRKKLKVKVVSFEDLYNGPVQNRIDLAKDTFEFVGTTFDESKKEVANRMFSGGQKSNRLFSFIPNFELTWDSLNKHI